MALDRILQLGNPLLYETCAPVEQAEIKNLAPQIEELHGLVVSYRAIYGAGRAIAAPQIGLLKRIICYNHTQQQTIINPVLSELSDEMIELWDDCMSFPTLQVRVKRHQSCVMTFRDEQWIEHTWILQDDLSELMQHEYDHLNGVLATMRAIDNRSYKVVNLSAKV